MNREKIMPKVIAVVLILAMALLSVSVFAKSATAPETYAKTVQAIDDKKATVMALTASAAVASTVLASAPGDITNPVANQIMAISEYLFIVICFLVLEKSLLTVMGYLSFNILIPSACALLLISLVVGKKVLKVLAAKIVVFALVLVTIIPFSVKISDMIYDMNGGQGFNQPGSRAGVIDTHKVEFIVSKVHYKPLLDRHSKCSSSPVLPPKSSV